MTSQGSPYARFRRALDSRNATVALATATELDFVSLPDALELVLLLVDDPRRFRRTLAAGLLLLGCWTSRALGSTLLLSAIGVPFSPTLALAVLCMSAATAILPITAGGAVAGMGTTAGVLFALGVSKGAAVNFALASGLLLTGAALAAAVLGLGGSLVLTFRSRRPRAAAIPARWADTMRKPVAVSGVARSRVSSM